MTINFVLPLLFFQLAQSLQLQTKWDIIFFLEPGNTFVDDGTRYMEQSSLDERIKKADKLKALLKEYNLEDKVIYLKGFLKKKFFNNFNIIKNYINNLLYDNTKCIYIQKCCYRLY
jgi:nicotinamide riboside kinase